MLITGVPGRVSGLARILEVIGIQRCCVLRLLSRSPRRDARDTSRDSHRTQKGQSVPPNANYERSPVGRRNWTFAGSDEGGRRTAAIYTLIATAKLNDIDPQAWPGQASGLELAKASAEPCRRGVSQEDT